ncbi:DNA replication complex GINS protein SLD5 [Echinococcus granulosus]|uniref:DNA replication complex GINS protein SLD5 n=2 Tax=Echinococcus granulosus TaxID=6210 RepID=W6UGQ2_ECHGR|nr:DNA replication complex GINS protein SLD5 [Echinococcus granulosus]EUB60148.1 DNA replication complex GINS protein SLD5 [Echinococcus granulosus]
MSGVACRWSNCSQILPDIPQLEVHLISAHIPKTTSNGYIRGSDYSCGWPNCVYPISSCCSVRLATFIRHVKFHAFVEYLIQRNRPLLPAPISCIKKCNSYSEHLPFDYECACGFSTDSFLVLFDHLRTCKQENCAKMEDFKAFVCPKCLKTFETIDEVLAQAVNDPRKSNNIAFRTGFFCSWIGCMSSTKGFASLKELLEHAEDHLTSSPMCLWMGCPVRKNFSRPHLFLHAYSNVCRNSALEAIKERPEIVMKCLSKRDDMAVPCGCHKARSNWFLEHLQSTDYDGLHCRWSECRLKYENPNEFCEHVLGHVGAKEEQSMCLWYDELRCGVSRLCAVEIAKGVRAHVRELHTVPRFLCPFCLLATYTRKCDLLSHIFIQIAIISFAPFILNAFELAMRCVTKRKSTVGYKRNLKEIKLPLEPVPLLPKPDQSSSQQGEYSTSAPDIDEIIGGSDEENVELFGPLGQPSSSQATESVTLPQLIKRFYKIWQNEKIAPELMPAQIDAVALISREVTNFETQAKSLPKGDIRAQLIRMQAERLRYLLTDYLRTRIRKIEQFPHYVISEERSRPQTEDPHLTPAEFTFTKTFDDLTIENLRFTVLDHLPHNMSKVDQDAIAFRPNLDAYVFCQVHSRIEVTNTDPSGASSEVLTLMPGEIHLLPYRAVQKHTKSGSVTLI